MRASLLLLVLAGLACPLTGQAQQPPAPPQSFLLGAWTGGLFPPPTVVSAGQCLAQPTVIFTQDVVMHASFTEAFYTQRMVETVRGTGNGLVFRFSAATNPQSAALTGLGGGDSGFGCDNPDELPVERIGPNQISFPGCKDFPFPLVRCPAG